MILARKFQIAAGSENYYSVFADYLRVKFSLVPLTVKTNDGDVFELEQGEEVYFKTKTELRISHESVSEQVVKLVFATGGERISSAKIAGQVDVKQGGNVLNTGLINVAIVSTLLVALNENRKGLRIFNSGATAIYIGGAGIDTVNGCVKLNAGELWVESEAAPASWYAVSDGGVGTVKVQELI